MITYNPGADGYYISKQDRQVEGLPLCKSTKCVGVANGGTSHAQHITKLPFSQLLPQATQADSLPDFSTALMSVRKTADGGTISIFIKDSVKVHKKHDVFITCQGKPLLIGIRDEHGRYHIPLLQQKGQWQPQCPRTQVNTALQQANSV
jgi:hypothetical protein